MRILLIVLVAALTGCATYEETVMRPWGGAPERELVGAWGYPASANDIVRIDASTKVYTYRYVTSDAMGNPSTCRITFTLTDGVVSRWEYNGAGCPRNKRG